MFLNWAPVVVKGTKQLVDCVWCMSAASCRLWSTAALLQREVAAAAGDAICADAHSPPLAVSAWASLCVPPPAGKVVAAGDIIQADLPVPLTSLQMPQKEKVAAGDVIYIESNSGAVKRVGRCILTPFLYCLQCTALGVLLACCYRCRGPVAVLCRLLASTTLAPRVLLCCHSLYCPQV